MLSGIYRVKYEKYPNVLVPKFYHGSGMKTEKVREARDTVSRESSYHFCFYFYRILLCFVFLIERECDNVY